MTEIKQYPVLEYIVNVLKNAIADAKIEKQSSSEFVIKDGNDVIHLKQVFDESGNLATIFITDKKHIIFSEDLLDTLQNIDEDATGDLKEALQTATIIINDLNVETELIFQAAKDFLDQLSNSYEFVKVIEKDVTKLKIQFKFGKHVFDLTIVNEPTSIAISPEFAPSFDAGIKKTIEEDVLKVQKAINKMFKED